MAEAGEFNTKGDWILDSQYACVDPDFMMHAPSPATYPPTKVHRQGLRTVVHRLCSARSSQGVSGHAVALAPGMGYFSPCQIFCI